MIFAKRERKDRNILCLFPFPFSSKAKSTHGSGNSIKLSRTQISQRAFLKKYTDYVHDNVRTYQRSQSFHKKKMPPILSIVISLQKGLDRSLKAHNPMLQKLLVLNIKNRPPLLLAKEVQSQNGSQQALFPSTKHGALFFNVFFFFSFFRTVKEKDQHPQEIAKKKEGKKLKRKTPS